VFEYRISALIALAILFGTLEASAQTARISGRVTDATGAVVPATAVTVTNLATGANRRVTTNAEGYYAVPLLLPGGYRVSVEHPGFKPIVQSGIVLEVDQRAELNFTLEVGGVSERVEVQAGATLLNTAEGGQGQVIENARIVELPLNGRTYDDLALGAPGAVQSLNGARFSGFSSGGMRDTRTISPGRVDNNPVELAGASAGPNGTAVDRRHTRSKSDQPTRRNTAGRGRRG
jgi:hypothetical protein